MTTAFRSTARRGLLLSLAASLATGGLLLAQERPPYVLFESGPVRPLALSPSGDRLFVANTPDNRLEILRVTESGLEPAGSLVVGLEPVAVAARSDDEVWVVNHLSDSVSVVDLSGETPRVARTLLVGDEPRDVVFAGGPTGSDRAFVTTAHRGQHRTHPSIAGVPGAGDPRFFEPGVGRADVWVFDAAAPGAALGGRPLRIVTLYGDTPRALAASPDGAKVYAAVFHSGNRTATVSASVVCPGFAETDLPDACPEHFPGSPGDSPGPATNRVGAPAPHVGLIVRYDEEAQEWRDELGRGWNHGLRFTLADRDLFTLDANTLEVEAAARGVGTVLFNVAVNPKTGAIYVSNTEARNEVRFEGPGTFGGSTVQGRLAEARITILDGNGVAPRHLNKHIDYDARPAPPGAKEHSLATPTDLVVSSDGATLYVAAFGSSKVGVYDTGALEDDTFDPVVASDGHVTVSGGGPSGLALDEARGRLYVATRFDNGLSVVDLGTRTETQHLTLFDVEPARVVEGRPFLYDAQRSSSNGEASCSSCHVFGDTDGLAWDLGNPDADVVGSPLGIVLGPDFAEAVYPDINGTGNADDFHPMKGPMTTQTLRGMVNSGPMHWRGDRSVGAFGTDPGDSDLSFRNFNPAFVGLLGGTSMLRPEEIQAFADFALEITLPPNPIRSLDNGLSDLEEHGERLFFSERLTFGLERPIRFGLPCFSCHTTRPEQGRFGTDGRQAFESDPQTFKVPHLRNAYQKVGMFGTPRRAGDTAPDPGDLGEQVRGFGYSHDGSVDTLFRFFASEVFAPRADGGGLRDEEERSAMARFVLAFDTDLAPVVGQQVTLDAGASAKARAERHARLDLLESRAAAPFTSKILGGEVTECDLVAKGALDGEARGALYDPKLGAYRSDRDSDPPLSSSDLRALAERPGQELTFTCVPPGSGVRVGLDRDLDGHFDRDELDAGADPADPTDRPLSCVANDHRLCLQGGRFAVTVDWRTEQPELGAGALVPGASDDSGLLWFFDADNWEMLVKVLDGCAINERFWVFSAASTTIGYELRVRDLVADEVVVYESELGAPARAIGDTDAFATCDARAEGPFAGSPPPVREAAAAHVTAPDSVSAPASAGTPCGDGDVCLRQGRFRVDVSWRAAGGDTGTAGRVPLVSDDSALLWFFGADNWEMLVKVLDGCAVNGSYWVFGSAATDVEYTLTVTDTQSGERRRYENALGELSPAIADTSAFGCSAGAPGGR